MAVHHLTTPFVYLYHTDRMSKPHVAPQDLRIIISARVTPEEKDTLFLIGDGNISKGLDRLLMALGGCWPAPAKPAAASLVQSSSESQAG